MNRRHARRPTPATRRGMTLVELLAVVLIIGILIALLVPAVIRAVDRARDAQAIGEMNQLTQALNDFKSKYGDYPPSRILLDESGNYYQYSSNFNTLASSSSTNDITYAALAQRSLSYLRKFYPRMTGLGAGALQLGTFYDFNGDGQMNLNGPYILQGHQCLVFFLGGVSNRSIGSGGVAQYGMMGIGKNPANPFPPLPFASAALAANREAPLFEFRGNRLFDATGTNFPGYLDPIGSGNSARFYAYFSSYGNNGYDPNDVNVPMNQTTGIGGFDPNDLADNNMNYSGSLVYRTFSANFSVVDPTLGTTNFVKSVAPNPYTTTTPYSTTSAVTTFVNPNTFQILSAGLDGLYGIGGQFSPNATTGNRLPLDAGIFPQSSGQPDPLIRAREADNVTNFATGRLQ